MTTALAELNLDALESPLRRDEGGTVRIGRSRITLDLIVEQYENGMTPEDLVQAYDTLELADVYATISYYLRHRDEVRAYLERRSVEGDALRIAIESGQPAISRSLLLSRPAAGNASDAPTGR
jgi:uncharacterized protein (DUF433 family)